ncbi:MAG: TldD/PmbA family protein [Infirmifilum sp.]|jgi:TldD protein|uniref:TldD/PmbA family protein n=1 Tax=Infirmifilum TaxID=2856573 RepID=UPI002355F9C5
MTWKYEDLVLLAVEKGSSLGAQYVEARYHKHSRSSLAARNGEIIGAESSVSEGVAVRVIAGGALGFASTNVLTREGVQDAVQKAVRKAQAHSKLMKNPVEYSHERLGRATYEVNELVPFENTSVEEKVSYIKDLWKQVSSSISTARVATLTTWIGESVEEKVIANSDGAFIRSRIPRLSLGYNIVVTLPSKGTIQRFFSHAGSGGYELLKKWNVIGYLPEDTRKFEQIILEAKSPPTDKPVDVVVGSEIVGLMVHESSGHPSEADRILGREAAQAGKSFIKPNMIGERIGSEYATVIDDPTIPGSNGFYLYDDEGVPARPRYLYKEGKINEFLHNRWTAKVFGVSSNAAARAMNYESEPIIRMANTYFKPGDHTFEELVEGVKFGVYIKSYMEWNIDDERWSQRYGGLEAYLIENGELRHLVKNPVLELTTKTFYSSVDAADKNLEFYAGTCGKGEPMQGVPVWFGGPNVRIRNVLLRVIA